MTSLPPYANPKIATAFDTFPEGIQIGALALRQMIFETAQSTPEVGPLEECLKWGQPAYLTRESDAGTTLRIGAPKAGGYALYVHCQTTLIRDFRSLFPDEFSYEGNRAILFPEGQDLPKEPLRLFITNALTYHLK